MYIQLHVSFYICFNLSFWFVHLPCMCVCMPYKQGQEFLSLWCTHVSFVYFLICSLFTYHLFTDLWCVHSCHNACRCQAGAYYVWTTYTLCRLAKPRPVWVSVMNSTPHIHNNLWEFCSVTDAASVSIVNNKLVLLDNKSAAVCCIMASLSFLLQAIVEEETSGQ